MRKPFNPEKSKRLLNVSYSSRWIYRKVIMGIQGNYRVGLGKGDFTQNSSWNVKYEIKIFENEIHAFDKFKHAIFSVTPIWQFDTVFSHEKKKLYGFVF